MIEQQSHTHIIINKKSLFLNNYQEYKNFYENVYNENDVILTQAGKFTKMRFFLDVDKINVDIEPLIKIALTNLLGENVEIYTAKKPDSFNLHITTNIVLESYRDIPRNIFQRVLCEMLKDEIRHICLDFQSQDYLEIICDSIDSMAQGLRCIYLNHPTKLNGTYSPVKYERSLETFLKFDPCFTEGYQKLTYTELMIHEAEQILRQRETNKFTGFTLNTELIKGTLTKNLAERIVRTLPKVFYTKLWRYTCAAVLGLIDQFENDYFINLFDNVSQRYAGYDQSNNTFIYSQNYKTSNFIKIANRYLEYNELSYYEKMLKKAKAKPVPNKLQTLENEQFDFTGKNLIVSSCGTGKTKLLLKNIDQFERVLFVTYRRSLAKNLYDRLEHLDFVHYKDHRELTQARIICQVESLYKLKTLDFDLLVIDEAKSFFHQLESKFIKNSLCYANAEYLLINTPNQCLMDAYWNEHDTKKFELYNKIDKTLYNNYNPERQLNLMKPKQLIANIVKDLNKNLNLVIPCNSKKFIKRLRIIIEKKTNVKPLIYVGDDKEDRLIRVEDWDVQCLIYSPCVESGLSYEKHHFDKLYGYFINTSTNCSSSMQMIYRVRNIRDSYNICFKTIPEWRETDFDMLEQHITSRYVEQDEISLNIIRRDSNGNLYYPFKDNYYYLHLYNMQADNEDINNFIINMLNLFLSNRFKINVCHDEIAGSVGLKEAKAELEDEDVMIRLRDSEKLKEIFETDDIETAVRNVKREDMPKFKRLKHREFCRQRGLNPSTEILKRERLLKANTSYADLRNKYNGHLINYTEFLLEETGLSNLREVNMTRIDWQEFKNRMKDSDWRKHIKIIGSLFGKRVRADYPSESVLIDVMDKALLWTYGIKITKHLDKNDGRGNITSFTVECGLLNFVPLNILENPFPQFDEKVEKFKSTKPFLNIDF